MLNNFPNPTAFQPQNHGLEEEQDPEVELAYALQKAQPGDPRITTVLLENYAAALGQFISAVYETFTDQFSPQTTVEDIFQRTIREAVLHVDQFWGKDSVKNWLFTLALNTLRKTKRWSASSLFKAKSEPHAELISDINQRDCYLTLMRFPQQDRLIILLRYLFQRSASDIAHILGNDPSKIANNLNKYRRKLLASYQGSDQTQEVPHPNYTKQISLAHDGILEDRLETRMELTAHLNGCPACQYYANQLDDLEKTIQQVFTERWPLLILSNKESDELAERINNSLVQPVRLDSMLQPIWKGAWIGVTLIVIAALGWYLLRVSYEQDEQMPLPTSTPLPLPAPIDIASYSILSPELLASGSEGFIQIHPATSGGGKWITFSLSAITDEGESRINFSDIFIYDRENRLLKRLIFPGNGPQFLQWEYAPWSDVITEPEMPAGTPVQVYPGEDDSADNLAAFFYDRDNDQRVRIDLSLNHRQPDVSNFYPTVSPNGQFLAFWSNGRELVPEGSPTCLPDANPDQCLDVFIVDLQFGGTRRVPVGRTIEQLGKNAHLSITDNGQLLGLTILITDRLAPQLGLVEPSEAFIYDLLADYYIPVNLSSERIPGNGPSLMPVISADGSLVAFASLANNLVSNDTNQEADIFIYNLNSSQTIQIPLPENEPIPAGTTDSIDRYYGFWMDQISFSPNGKHLAVLSTLENLTNHYRLGCSASPGGYCLTIFVHDLENGETEKTNTYQIEDRNRVLDIAEDGELLTNFEYYSFCPVVLEAEVCAEIWQQDRDSLAEDTQRYGYYASHYSRWLHTNLYDGLDGAANVFSLSPDGDVLAVGTKEDTVKLWQLSTKQPLGSLRGNSSGSIYGLDFSPDGQYLAAGSSTGTVHIWHLSDPSEVYSLINHPGRVIGLKFSPFNDELVVATSRQIWVWHKDGRTFERTYVLDYPGNFVNDFDLSPDGKWVAVAGEDKTAWLQNVDTGKVVIRLAGHQHEVTNVEFSPDGEYLAVGDTDGKINLWHLEWFLDKDPLAAYQKTLQQSEWVTNLGFTKDGTVLASSSFSGLLRLWRLSTEELLETPPTDRFDFMPNGIFLFDGQQLIAGSSSGLIHLWHGPTNLSTSQFFIRSELEGLSDLEFSPTDPSGDIAALHGSQLSLALLYVNIYQAGGMSLFNVQAPVYLPPMVEFMGARLGSGDIIVFQYEVLDRVGDDPIAQLYISQHTELPTFLVGMDTTIEQVEIEGRSGEYVEGDWVLSGVGSDEKTFNENGSQWHWDPSAPVARLRWREGRVTIAIHYKPLTGSGNTQRIFTRDDLIGIAENMALITKPTLQGVTDIYD